MMLACDPDDLSPHNWKERRETTLGRVKSRRSRTEETTGVGIDRQTRDFA